MGIVLLCVLLAGCASGHTTAQTPRHPWATATSTTVITPPLTTLPGPPVSAQQAWGTFTITRLPTDQGDNQVFAVKHTATPDGQWLVGSVAPRDFFRNTTRLSYLALYNVHTRQVVRLHALLNPQSQLITVTVDDHWIAWSEADDQPNFFDWSMFLYNRDTGQVTSLAQAPRQADGRPAPGPFSGPEVSGGHILWSQPTAAITPGNDASLDHVVVYLKDLSTENVATLATRAGGTQLAWPWGAWAQLTSGGNGYTVVKNLVSGQETHLEQHFTDVSFSGTSAAFDDYKALWLAEDVPGHPDQLRKITSAAFAHSSFVEFVTLNDRLLAWQQGTEDVPVWDRAQGCLVLLPKPPGYSDAWVSGKLLVWSEAESAAQQQQDTVNHLDPTPTLDVVDTTTLPMNPPH